MARKTAKLEAAEETEASKPPVPAKTATAIRQTASVRKKQAVVVIHGMGEQRPMETLRSFVNGLYSVPDAPVNGVGKKGAFENLKRISKAVFNRGPVYESDKFYIVPDSRTKSSELSRIRASSPLGAGNRRSTDFFELYYSDQLTGNSLEQLTGWIRGLLLRWPHQVPKQQWFFWPVLWILSLLVVYLVGSEITDAPIERLKKAIFEPGSQILAGGFSMAAGLSSALGAILLAWYLTGLVRTHMGNPQNGKGESDERESGELSIWLSYLCAVLAPVALGFLFYRYFPWAFLFGGGWRSVKLLLAAFIVFVITKLGVPIFGDVARYLRNAPDALSARESIRSRGLTLLEALHDSKLQVIIDGKPAEFREYDRIIICAHSLGSIVGYDILRLLWAKRGASEDKPLSVETQCRLDELDKLVSETGGLKSEQDVAKYVKLQGELSLKLSGEPKGWLVSDFVTMGSPLAHADFLMARDRPRFEKLKHERVFPTCPPMQENGPNTPRKPSFIYKAAGQDPRAHHAAVFAPTRWTAIFDPVFAIVIGDFVGGKLQRNFGNAITEIPVKLYTSWWRFVTHTNYWSPKAAAELEDENGYSALPEHVKPSIEDDKLHLRILRKIIWDV
jgi:hypothetical protein